MRDMARRRSSWRSQGGFPEFLVEQGIPAITGVDTRRLTRHLREFGSIASAFGTASVEALLLAAKNEPGTDNCDLATVVSTTSKYLATGFHGKTAAPSERRLEASEYRCEASPLSIVAYDFGIKTSILRQLRHVGEVTVVPANTSAQDVLAMGVDGVFLSNGPGDPAALSSVTSNIQHLLGRVPIFGICLGHQILATSLGASTYKLRFGHHGGNHPVRNIAKSTVEITSQNHNYAVADDLPSGVRVTHVNLNDGVVEGFSCSEIPAFGVQYHPEAGPGPHEARYLFDDFKKLIESHRESIGISSRMQS